MTTQAALKNHSSRRSADRGGLGDRVQILCVRPFVHAGAAPSRLALDDGVSQSVDAAMPGHGLGFETTCSGAVTASPQYA